MSRSLNPYIAGNPVGNSDSFVGRVDIMHRVVRIFSRSEENAIVLYGQRRIGKTSVLQYLKKTLSKQENGNYLPVYFDLQDKADWSLDDVLNNLATTIANELGFQAPQLGKNIQHSFQHEWLAGHLNNMPNETGLVLLFDEFDVLASEKAGTAGSKFFPYLRQLITSDPEHINFVFVIGRNVDDLSSIALSLFKGIPTQRISLLNKNDTFGLIRLSEKNSPLRWSNDSLDRIWQLTNGHAFFTQQLCSYAWEEAYDDGTFDSEEISVDVINEVIEDVLDASRNTLEWLWDGLPPAERVVSSALAEAGSIAVSEQELENLLHESGVRIVIRELQDAPRLLQEWDLLEPVGEKFRFRVELLRRWIMDNKPLRRVQEELDRIEPVAESLFQAAQGLYGNQQLEQAEAPVRQAIGLNPNHVGANQLLADLLLGQDKYDEAKDLLISLYEYQPVAARSRLIQTWLRKAVLAKNEDDKLQCYEKILAIDECQIEAKKGYKTIWEKKGDEAQKKGLFREAINAYDKAKVTEKVIVVKGLIYDAEIKDDFNKVLVFKKAKKYHEALDFINSFEKDHKISSVWKNEKIDIDRLLTMDTLYKKAIQALELGNKKEAQGLFVEVIGIDPGFEEAAYHLHQTVIEERGLDKPDNKLDVEIDIEKEIPDKPKRKFLLDFTVASIFSLMCIFLVDALLKSAGLTLSNISIFFIILAFLLLLMIRKNKYF